MFAEVGIRPWEISDLTYEQLLSAQATFDDQIEKNKT